MSQLATLAFILIGLSVTSHARQWDNTTQGNPNVTGDDDSGDNYQWPTTTNKTGTTAPTPREISTRGKGHKADTAIKPINRSSSNQTTDKKPKGKGPHGKSKNRQKEPSTTPLTNKTKDNRNDDIYSLEDINTTIDDQITNTSSTIEHDVTTQLSTNVQTVTTYNQSTIVPQTVPTITTATKTPSTANETSPTTITTSPATTTKSPETSTTSPETTTTSYETTTTSYETTNTSLSTITTSPTTITSPITRGSAKATTEAIETSTEASMTTATLAPCPKISHVRSHHNNEDLFICWTMEDNWSRSDANYSVQIATRKIFPTVIPVYEGNCETFEFPIDEHVDFCVNVTWRHCSISKCSNTTVEKTTTQQPEETTTTTQHPQETTTTTQHPQETSTTTQQPDGAITDKAAQSPTNGDDGGGRAMAATFVVLVLIAVSAIVIYKTRKHWIRYINRRGRGTQLASISLNSITSPLSIYNRPIVVADFEQHFNVMSVDSKLRFSVEFEDLNAASSVSPCTAALIPENQPKNRWTNILPFDHSRVKLLPMADDVSSDYINANYIPGYNSQREYIATQGPLPSTVDDFWRMVWEQGCAMIVMLTQCTERGKVKCEQYWPKDRQTQYYGDLAISLKSESILAEYTIRIFDLQLGSRVMEVKQTHFTMWPDFGCPESTHLLLNFIYSVGAHMPHCNPGPIIVHCSAGVGRTGTYIAVERLIQHVRDFDTVDVYHTVRDMRRYRNFMVQTEDQYVYIHECVRDYLKTVSKAPSELSATESQHFINKIE